MTASAPSPDSDAAARRRPSLTRSAWLLIVVATLVVLMMLSVAVGSRDVSWNDIIAGLGGSNDNLSQAAVVKRVPRTLLAMIAGAALGLAGAAMQGITRNPLADPGRCAQRGDRPILELLLLRVIGSG